MEIAEKVMMQEKTTQSCAANNITDLRAEELIVGIYKRKLDLQKRGITAKRVVVTMEVYKKIKLYHLGLGVLQGNQGDYITDDEIFGIPFYIDHVDGIIVE